MALSNWDTLALDHNSEPVIDGTFTSPLGISVSIYKNWLYVRDEKCWSEGSFSKPTVLEVQSGDITYKDVHILASGGPQNSIFTVVTTNWNGREALLGIGCYGYDEDGEWVGVLPETLNRFRMQLQEWVGLGEVGEWVLSVDFSKALRTNQGDSFFENKLNLPSQSTKPGEANTPVMIRLLKNNS